MKIVFCKACGKAFLTSSKRACYCSPECKEYGLKENRKAWEDRRPGYMAEYMRKYRQRRPK